MTRLAGGLAASPAAANSASLSRPLTREDISLFAVMSGDVNHDVMPEWVREAVMKIPGVEHVDVTLTFAPPWTPDRIATAGGTNDRAR